MVRIIFNFLCTCRSSFQKCGPLINREGLLLVIRGCQASQRQGLTSGEVRRTSGEVGELPGKSGKLLGNFWKIFLESTERERSSGEVAGQSRDFPEAGVSLTPSQRLAKIASKLWQPVLKLGSRGPGKVPGKGKSPKVVGAGCKRSFRPREQRSPKAFCTTQTLSCTCATPFRTGARGFLLAGCKRRAAPQWPLFA